MAFVRRYNNQPHERTGFSPSKVVAMGAEELKQVKQNIVKQGVIRHAHTGTKLRKLKKGDWVRIVEDKFRRATEKSDIGKAHLDYGIRW